MPYLLSLHEKEIKEVMVSVAGQRLLACMLLVQPVTAKELRYFLEFWIKFYSVKDKSSNMASINQNQDFSPFNPIVDTTDVYDKDRVLKKAIDCGLIIEVPMKTGWKKNSYYFLNSDIVFNMSSSGIEITENKEVYPKLFKHHTFAPKENKKTVLKEYIAFHKSGIGNPSDEFYRIRDSLLKEIFTLFWWMIRHQSLISDTINVYRTFEPHKHVKIKHVEIDDLPEKWRRYHYLYRKAKGEVFMNQLRPHDSILLHPWFSFFTRDKMSLSFVPSYSVLECFSNFKKHIGNIIDYDEMKYTYKRTPMDLLEILTSEKYEIIPWQRQRVFTSILGYENVDKNTIYVPEDISKKYRRHLLRLIESDIKFEETCWIDRNTSLAKNVISSILLPKGMQKIG